MNLKPYKDRQTRAIMNTMRLLLQHKENPLYNKIKLGVEISKHLTPTTHIRPLYHTIFEKLNNQTDHQSFARPPLYCTEFTNLIYQTTCDVHTFKKDDIQNDKKFQEWINKYHVLYKDRLIPIFTDGSKTLEGTGAAYYNQAQEISQKIQLSNKWSVYNAEVIAIRAALLSALNYNNAEKK